MGDAVEKEFDKKWIELGFVFKDETREMPKPPGAGDKVKVHQETDNEAIRTDYLKLNWDDYTYTRTRKRKAVQAPAAT